MRLFVSTLAGGMQQCQSSATVNESSSKYHMNAKVTNKNKKPNEREKDKDFRHPRKSKPVIMYKLN